tara:strand:- start:118 stop:243 length:126 start_codon:yes stop_codon:yes gene_type:complete
MAGSEGGESGGLGVCRAQLARNTRDSKRLPIVVVYEVDFME